VSVCFLLPSFFLLSLPIYSSKMSSIKKINKVQTQNANLKHTLHARNNKTHKRHEIHDITLCSYSTWGLHSSSMWHSTTCQDKDLYSAATKAYRLLFRLFSSTYRTDYVH
jgi:hypothetical protein